MSAILKITRYEIRDVMRSRWLVVYGAFFLVATLLLFQFSGPTDRAVISLANLSLAIIPLVAILFSTMYLYNSRDFVEMLLAQPVDRKALFIGQYAGLILPITGAFVLGTSIPMIANPGQISVSTVATLIICGVLLGALFLALGVLITVRIEDRVKGLAAAIMIWLFFIVVYDAVLLAAVRSFSDYPLEGALIVATLLNPIDLARVLMMLQLDIAAMMGYTGAVFEQFFGTVLGMALSGTSLIIWCVVPLLIASRGFQRKDF
jgi:Cu-processing system permease protein